MPYDKDRCWICGSVSTAIVDTYTDDTPVCSACEGPTLARFQRSGVSVWGVRRLADPAHRGLTPRRKGIF